MRTKHSARPKSPPPIILVAPSTERAGAEFKDWSVSLSNRYTDAVISVGGLPQILPATTHRQTIAEAVRLCHGVLLTGGDDIDPKLYVKKLPAGLAQTTGEHDAKRDIWEKQLIEEIFAQRKPLFGICRGHQMLNVALGGTLIVDIPLQVPNALNHNQFERRTEPVHEVSVTPGSLLAAITGESKIGVNSTHHQGVGRLAEDLRAVGQSADGVIEAMELKVPGRLPFCLTVQFHPERMLDREAMFLRLFSRFVEASGEKAVAGTARNRGES